MFFKEFAGTVEEINSGIAEELQGQNLIATSAAISHMTYPRPAKYNEGTAVPGTWVCVVQFTPGPVKEDDFICCLKFFTGNLDTIEEKFERWNDSWTDDELFRIISFHFHESEMYGFVLIVNYKYSMDGK